MKSKISHRKNHLQVKNLNFYYISQSLMAVGKSVEDIESSQNDSQKLLIKKCLIEEDRKYDFGVIDFMKLKKTELGSLVIFGVFIFSNDLIKHR